MGREPSKSYSIISSSKSIGTLWTHRGTRRPVAEAGEEGAAAAGADLGGVPAPKPRRQPDLRAPRAEPGEGAAERVSKSVLGLPQRLASRLQDGFLGTKSYTEPCYGHSPTHTPASVCSKPASHLRQVGLRRPSQPESPPTGRRMAQDGARSQSFADRAAARHHLHRQGPDADPAGPWPFLPRPRVSDQPTRWVAYPSPCRRHADACCSTEASRTLFQPATLPLCPHTHTRCLGVGGAADGPTQTRTRSPHSDLGHAVRPSAQPAGIRMESSPDRSLSAQPRAAGLQFLWAALPTCSLSLPRTRLPTYPAHLRPKAGPAAGPALLASVSPFQSDCPASLTLCVCYSPQAPDRRRDRGPHLRDAVGRGAAARDRRLPFQVLLLPLPRHLPGSLRLASSTRQQSQRPSHPPLCPRLHPAPWESLARAPEVILGP